MLARLTRTLNQPALTALARLTNDVTAHASEASPAASPMNVAGAPDLGAPQAPQHAPNHARPATSQVRSFGRTFKPFRIGGEKKAEGSSFLGVDADAFLVCPRGPWHSVHGKGIAGMVHEFSLRRPWHSAYGTTRTHVFVEVLEVLGVAFASLGIFKTPSAFLGAVGLRVG